MPRSTIDYGIDLGTTNSAIAFAASGVTEIIKNNLDADTTPSAVYINRSGHLWIGQSARSKYADERTEDDIHLEFKRRMGSGHEYQFKASGRRLRPEELAAELLKSLRADVAQKKGEDLDAAVITVPAAFELPQCDATRAAARLAGFAHAPLLQEPVAAALAYGFNKIEAHAHWLVFDFGGGTFDAALIRAQDGSLVVDNHEGDNFLGGSDLDWAIVEQLLLPRIQTEFKAPGFRRGEARHRHDLLRLKAAAETAKIDLSRSTRTILEISLRSLGPEPLLYETELTRADLARVCEPLILKSASIALRTIQAKDLAPSAIEKLIFVGGPTLAPYFRETLAGLLPIPADFSVDPLTVVARGAALFASSQPLPTKARSVSTPAPAGSPHSLTLIYKPVGTDPEPIVGGRLQPAPDAPLDLATCTVELVHAGTKWRGGRTALRSDGTFQLTARAERDAPNQFLVEIRDARGALLPVSPDRFTYTLGLVVEDQTVIHRIGVARADNTVSIHFDKGQHLPAKSTRSYRTATPVARGASSLLRIPVVEGGQDRADRNLLVGAIEISADSLSRELPVGTEVEVTLRLDPSRLLDVVAYVPLLDAEFPARIELGGESRQPSAATLLQDLEAEFARIERLLSTSPVGDPGIRPLRALPSASLATRLRQVLERPEPDMDELLRAERDLLEFKLQIDAHEARLAWPAAAREAQARLDELRKLVEMHGTREERTRFRQVSDRLERSLKERRTDRLRLRLAELEDVRSALETRLPAFWIKHFESLADYRDHLLDPAAADPLIARGRAEIATHDIAALQETIFKLQALLPPTPAATSSAYGSTVVG